MSYEEEKQIPNARIDNSSRIIYEILVLIYRIVVVEGVSEDKRWRIDETRIRTTMAGMSDGGRS